MNYPASSHYETVATAFQVAEIAHPLRTFVKPDDTVEDAVIEIGADATEADDPDNWFGLVRDEQKIHGYIALDFIFDEDDEKFDGPREGKAVDYCTPITPDQLVPGSMPLLDLIPLFRIHPLFFVLTRNDITHWASFSDLDKLPIKLCLFSLVMALEAEMITLLSADKPETYLNLLPEGRLQKARELYHQKHKEKRRVDPVGLLLCTNFVDKATMLIRSPQLFSALPFSSKRQAEQFLNRAQELRNQIAHSDSVLTVLHNPEEFDSFVGDLRKYTEAISNLHNV